MKLYGLVLLLCLSLLFIPAYSEAQTAPPSNETSNHTASAKTRSITEPIQLTDSTPSSKTSNQTIPSNKTSNQITSPNQTSNQITPSNQTTNQTVSSNQTLAKQTMRLLEQQFYKAGNTLFDQGNYTNAITYYDKALTLNSTDLNVLYNKALALDNLGRLDEAITYYDKVLSINPNDTDTLNNKGLALDKLGKHAEAITYYDKVLTINPADTYALYNKALALDSLGKHDEAIAYFKKVLAINPSDAAALNKLNLTFNNANKTATVGIQKTDQTLLIYVGVFAAVLIGIIIINFAAKRARRTSKEKALIKSGPAEVDQTQYKKPESEKIEDDEWEGI